MRIGIDARLWGTKHRGIGRYTAALLKELELIDDSNEYFIFLDDDGMKNYQPQRANFKKVRANFRVYGLAEQLFFPYLLLKHRLKVVHFTHFNVPLLFRDNFIVTIHDLIISHYPDQRATTLNPFWYKLKLFLYNLVISHSVNKAKKIIAVSNFTKNDIINLFKIPTDKIVVIYEGVDFSVNKNVENKEIIKRFNLTDDFLLYVGSAYPHKNLEKLIEAFGIVYSKYPNWQLVLVGKIDYFYKKLQEKITPIAQLLKLNPIEFSKKIVFTDYLNDQELTTLYQQAKLYVFPSLIEGFGLPPLEAQTYGLPVISSNQSCLPEILGDSAVYFDPKNTQEIAEKIQLMISDHNLRKQKITLPEGGTYDVRAGFNERLAPPQALSLVASRWEFQDANWWPDFPTSAANIKWFYEKSGGPTIDGVFAINSGWLAELLKIVGPIKLENYGKTISVENYEYELQKSIELEAKNKIKPKKILAELAPKLIEKILTIDVGKVLTLTEVIGRGLKQKDIMLYFVDPQLQQFILDNNYAGQLKDQGEANDYLSVVATNLGGGKTDNVIKQEIWHRAEIQDDGSIIDHLLIERVHLGPIDDFFTTLANNSYLRIYVPLGSELIYAEGFKPFDSQKFKKVEDNLEYKKEVINEDFKSVKDKKSQTKIYQENGKTVFANWSIIGPRESQKILLVYKLPFKVKKTKANKDVISSLASWITPEIANYGILLQKQSGRSHDQITSEIVYPQKFVPALHYPEQVEIDNNKIIFSTQTDSDKYLGVSFLLK